MNLLEWQKLSLAKQLGNIGSEISRAHHWEQRGDMASRNQALARSLELLDLTLSNHDLNNKFKELVRLREVIADLFIGQKYFNVDLQKIKSYCLTFALADRKAA